MNVTDKFVINPHSIEWGDATWNENDFSIRNRFGTASGKFNQAGSSEFPWYNFVLMITESIKREKSSNTELSQILTEISKKSLKFLKLWA